MTKINKLFKGMYIAMGISGVLMALLSFITGFKNNILASGIYSILLIVLASLAIITMLSIFLSNTIFKNADNLKLTVIRGHIALYFGFASYFVIMANDNNTELINTIALLGVFALYIAAMVFLFFWLIKRIEKKFNESEKDKIDG